VDLDSRPFKSRVTNKWFNVILELNGLLCVSDNDTYHVKQNRLLPTGERLSKVEYDVIELENVTYLRDLRSHMMDSKFYDLNVVLNLKSVELNIVTLRPHLTQFLRELSSIANFSI